MKSVNSCTSKLCLKEKKKPQKSIVFLGFVFNSEKRYTVLFLAYCCFFLMTAAG